MNPQEINQKTLDFAMRVHNNCMERCLEKEHNDYDIHQGIRELMIIECSATARHHQRWLRHITRFNPQMPKLVQYRRRMRHFG